MDEGDISRAVKDLFTTPEKKDTGSREKGPEYNPDNWQRHGKMRRIRKIQLLSYSACGSHHLNASLILRDL